MSLKRKSRDATQEKDQNKADGMSKEGAAEPEPGEVVDDEDVDFDNNDEMMKMMGFSSFGSTKGKEVESNKSTAAVGAALVEGGRAQSKAKKRTVQQYMNKRKPVNPKAKAAK